MDSPLEAAALALAQGDPLRSLRFVALRHDAQALALRATAMAQLGDYEQSRKLFRRALKGFSESHAIARARCLVAMAEVALAARELGAGEVGLTRAIETLHRHGDLANARHAQLLQVRHALALGELELARQRLERIDARALPAGLRASFELARAEIAQREVRSRVAHAALQLAMRAAQQSGIPALMAEVSEAYSALQRPVARLAVASGSVATITLHGLEALFAARRFVVDGCRRCVREGELQVSFAQRPVSFGLVRALAEVSPHALDRDALIRQGFGMKRVNDSLRARLRVAISRLRKQLKPLATLPATASGFALLPHHTPVHLLLPLDTDEGSALSALLADGQAWSTSALALALGSSQRSVQRALAQLEAEGRVFCTGRGKRRRWLTVPLQRFATPMLLPEPSRRP